MSRSHWAR